MGGPRSSGLPEPSTGSSLEVQFRRLLHSCNRQLQELETSATATSSTNKAATLLKLQSYIDTLREQLAELRAQQEDLGLDSALLDLYDTHVKAAAAAVPRVALPPYCQNLAVGAGGGGGGGSQASYFAPPSSRPNVTAKVPSAASLAAAKGAGEAGQDAFSGLSAAAADRLRQAENAQALLTDELAELTAQLKSNALGMQGAVADRGRLLDATDTALTESLVDTKRNVEKAKEQHKRSGGSFCFMCMVLLAVGLAFTAMVMYIKMTYFLGYKADRGTAMYGGGPSRTDAAGGWLGVLGNAIAGMLPGGGAGRGGREGAGGDGVWAGGRNGGHGGLDEWQGYGADGGWGDREF